MSKQSESDPYQIVPADFEVGAAEHTDAVGWSSAVERPRSLFPVVFICAVLLPIGTLFGVFFFKELFLLIYEGGEYSSFSLSLRDLFLLCGLIALPAVLIFAMVFTSIRNFCAYRKLQLEKAQRQQREQSVDLGMK